VISRTEGLPRRGLGRLTWLVIPKKREKKASKVIIRNTIKQAGILHKTPRTELGHLLGRFYR